MGRSRYTFRHNLTAERSSEVAVAFLSENGLKPIMLKSGERVWKNGNGLVVAPGFLSIYYEDYKTTVFAWIQTGMGLMARSEADLYGVGMAIPKRKLTKLLERLEKELQTAEPAEAALAETEPGEGEPEAEEKIEDEAAEEEP